MRKEFRQFGRETVKEIRGKAMAAQWQAAPDGVRIAKMLSSGTISTKVLRKLGHPYAVRAPNAAYDPMIINDQTGVFKAAWRVRPRSQDQPPVIDNTSTVAKFLEGAGLPGSNSKMVARHITDLVIILLDPIRKSYMDAEFRKK